MQDSDNGKPKRGLRDYFWIGYAGAFTVLTVTSPIPLVLMRDDPILFAALGLCVNFIALPGLWGLALRRRILRPVVWRGVLAVDVIVILASLFLDIHYQYPPLVAAVLIFIWAVLCTPYYFGLFIYGFRSKRIWQDIADVEGPTYMGDPYDISKSRRKRLMKTAAEVVVLFLCLMFIPLVIHNNRVVWPAANPPEFRREMFEYRRTTIPKLVEFEQLFANYLYEFDYADAEIVVDHNETVGKVAYYDPNSPVLWRLTAGLGKRYLVVMETRIVSAWVDPNTKEVVSPGSHETPAFSLWEVEGVKAPLVLFTVRGAWPYGRKLIKNLSPEEWKQLVQTNGDFEALGIKLKKDAPVRNFELAYRNND